MNAIIPPAWDGTDRRQSSRCRRSSDRRSYNERRNDPRQSQKSNRSFYAWVRSLTHARLGVDRRKQGDQRIISNRRNSRPSAMLTKEELADLLS
ncbi:hypothetical protein [Desulforhopalus sp. 52FAK]